ncbi:TonB-dependent receptor domain-containing protein [Silvibacterium acidisoli]|uniref:TonB-dependent receptor domain-containing protein n=1 Tax=Acidobacteriaceae bacterium ZG23-2 TaxID=2883246 RepID=UPI00406C5856
MQVPFFPAGASRRLRSFLPVFAYALLAALVVLLPAFSAFGQIVTASVRGTVQDPGGAVIAGASVDALNTATGVRNHVVADGGGRFVFASLAPGGPYTITVTANGFKSEDRTGIHLEVNQVVDLEIPLQLGSSQQRVEVHADATQLETSTAALGQVIDNRNIVDLPLNQRNVYSLIFLMPGVTGSVTYQYNSLNMSVNGGRPGATNLLLDGIPSSPPLIVPIGGFGAFPSVDAVQEFKVQTSSYSAEFGRSGSGIVNVILKSGTNDLHGSAYDFLRNSALDANNWFSNHNGTALPSFKRNQFGGSVTGPVVIPGLYHGRDKTFFMFSYEGLRQGTGSTLTTTVPTALERTGDFSQTSYTIYDPETTVSGASTNSGYQRTAFAGNKIPGNRIDSVAAAVVNYYPGPNHASTAAGLNNFFAAGVQTLNIDTYDTRVDEVINDRNRFFVRYSRRNLQQPPVLYFPAAQQVAEGGNSEPQTSNSAAIDYTFTASPTFLVDIPFGFSRTAINFVPVSAGFNPTTQLGFPGYIASNADHLLFPGIAPTNYYTLGDASQGETRAGGFNIFSIGVNNTKVQGNHIFKFGGAAWLLQANDVESGASTGSFNFTNAITQGPDPDVAAATSGNAIASLLLGVGSSGTYTINSKNAAASSKYYGLYVQDDWKVQHNVTFNLGLRYDLDIPRTERYNRMETFDPNIASPLAQTAGVAGLKGGTVFAGVDGLSRRQFAPQYHNFGPRFGFSWQVDNDSVVRGAYGVYYGPSMRSAGATIGQEGSSATTTYTGSADGLTPSVYLSNPFPNGLNQPANSSQGLLTGIGSSFENSLRGDNKVGYTENWSFGVQRQLPFQVLLDVAYVGSHGVHLNKSGESDWNANQLTPATLAQGSALQSKVANPFYGIITTGTLAGKTVPLSYLEAPFPQFTAVYLSYLTGGYADYNSFQLKLNKQLSHGLSALVSYTGQKQIDDYSGIENVGNITGGIQNIYNPRAERAVSSNDVSENLTISAIYSLPFGRGQEFASHLNRPLDLVIGGWQANGILTEHSGFPISVSASNTSDAGNNVERPNLTGKSPKTRGSVESRVNDYLNIAAFSQPAAFTFGNAPRTLSDARTPATHNLDFSLFKSFPVTQQVHAEFRAEAFNLFNQVVFGAPTTSITSTSFGAITSQLNTPREIQFALKFLF